MKKTLFILLAAAFSSCGTTQQKNEGNTETASFHNEKMQAIYDSYVKTKESLTESDPKKGAENAGVLATRLMALEDSSTTIKKAKEEALQMSKMADIKEQRTIFAALSSSCYLIFKKADKKGTLFLDHCPMAREGKGADWVSDKEEIKNPYYGTAMMECGEVKEKF